MSLRHTVAVSAILALAIVLFGGNAPSNYSTMKYAGSKEIAGTAIRYFNKAVAPSTVISKHTAKDCFPVYRHSLVRGSNCLAQIEVGPVIVHKSTYKVMDEDHCSYIVSKKVRNALHSAEFQDCIDGKYI